MNKTEMLQTLGVSGAVAAEALRRYDGDLERAAEWATQSGSRHRQEQHACAFCKDHLACLIQRQL